jgi:hypothetical protein
MKKATKKRLVILSLIIVLTSLIFLLLSGSLRSFDMHIFRKSVIGKSEQVEFRADSLSYTYSYVNKSGVPKPDRDYSIYLRYPAIPDSVSAKDKYYAWLLPQLFSLYNESNVDNEDCMSKYGTNLDAYAAYVMRFWESVEEYSWMGVMWDSLTVDVVLNTDLLTFKTYSSGFYGGANADRETEYTIMDRQFNIVDFKSLLIARTLPAYEKLLMQEYKKQIDAPYDYGRQYITEPSSIGLLPGGLVVVYSGRSHAEGYPTMAIEPDKFIYLLKPEYQTIYQKQ